MTELYYVRKYQQSTDIRCDNRMNILVLSGSPRGKYSVTLQTALYLELIYKDHNFEYLNIGARIKMFEKDKLAGNLVYALEHKYNPPQNFYGVGGMKIFRDLIWLMQGLMKADHRFYKLHKQYDFPQKKRGTMLKMYLVGALISSPKVKAKMGNRMNEGIIGPYKKVLEQSKAKLTK